MAIVREINRLPAAITAALEREEPGLGFVGALKTAYKATYDLPTTWLVATELGLIQCTTHKRRTILASEPWSDIDRVKMVSDLVGSRYLVISYKELGREDVKMLLPKKDSERDLAEFASLLEEFIG